MKTELTPCCDRFQGALREGFLVRGGRKVEPGDRVQHAQRPGPEGQPTLAGWSRTFGPEVACCPFCGRALAQGD